MVEDKRKVALRGLVVGDRVCVVTPYNKNFDYVVSRVTPSGIITVVNSEGYAYVFNPSGHLRGNDRIELYPYVGDKHISHDEDTRSRLLSMKAQELGKIVDLANTLADAGDCVDEDFVLQLTNIRYMLADLTLRV